MERNAAVALVLATPVAVWSFVGDLSVRLVDAELDYLVRAPQIPRLLELLVGVVALVVAVASAVVLTRALAEGRARQQWSATVVPLTVAGAIIGFGLRVVTAGGIGANIGGALMIMLAGPLVLALIVAAAGNAWYESRRR
jgi:hypothetical protein